MTEHAAPSPVAGNHAALAQRYVGALYALAEQESVLDAVADDMRALRRLWQECPEWRFIALDPRLNKVEIKPAVDRIVTIAGFGKLTGNFLAVVAKHHRLGLLPALVNGFLNEVAVRRGEHYAAVRVARPLTEAQNAALAKALAAITGGKTHLSVEQDPALLGGMTVQWEDKFIDASVKTRLERLERTLKGAA